MTSPRLPSPAAGFRTLRELARPRASLEQCELCGTAIAGAHPHLIEPATRRIACACAPCALLFAGGASARFRRIGRDVRSLPSFRLTDAQWDGLMIPINLAFFFHSTPAGRVVALYPSPAGPTESLLELDAWDEIVRDNPALAAMEPDTEALLVQRIRAPGAAARADYFIAPIDECFRLVGLIRANWRGLSGGADVWIEIARFFDELAARARCAAPATEADDA